MLEVPPYPDHDCPACERGEQTVTPPHSSVVGSMPVHQPSGNVCVKFIKPEILAILQRQQQERQKQLTDEVVDVVERADLPPAAVELHLYEASSPARPGNEPQDGDQDFALRVPLSDGTRLALHIGPPALFHFQAMLKAYEADTAREAGQPPNDALIVELGPFGEGKAATFRWFMAKMGENIDPTLAMFILAAAIGAGANERMEINISKCMRIMKELAAETGLDMHDLSIVPSSDQS
jgi:hypothetical protein